MLNAEKLCIRVCYSFFFLFSTQSQVPPEKSTKKWVELSIILRPLQSWFEIFFKIRKKYITQCRDFFDFWDSTHQPFKKFCWKKYRKKIRKFLISSLHFFFRFSNFFLQICFAVGLFDYHCRVNLISPISQYFMVGNHEKTIKVYRKLDVCDQGRI